MISWGVGFYSRVGFKWRRYGISNSRITLCLVRRKSVKFAKPLGPLVNMPEEMLLGNIHTLSVNIVQNHLKSLLYVVSVEN